MASRKPKQEQPTDAFEKLRQCFDVIKEKHSDPWCWHQYLEEEARDKEEEDEEDPEMTSLKPGTRKNVEKLKSHLLACVGELNRAAQAADMCYFHMCVAPTEMKDCAVILGSSGDIDEEMLLGGDASPAKIMAALQAKLDVANATIADLEVEVAGLKDNLIESRSTSEDRWRRWQESRMEAEEAITRLHWTQLALMDSQERDRRLQNAYNDLYVRFVRASRLMIYQARALMRNNIFMVRKKENLFYAFHGFMNILQTEKEERLRREREEQRNAIEFALRNEVRHLLAESARHTGAVGKLAVEACTLKRDRRALAGRILYKLRPYEPLEYCLWVWELWQPIRGQLVKEKQFEMEQATRDAVSQQLVHTSAQFPPLVERLEQLRIDFIAEQIAHDQSRRELTAEAAQLLSRLSEHLRAHRAQELAVLGRLHELDNEAKDERIAVLEREIAEDKHIHALKGMVVDLETNLRRALDRRKQRGMVVPPGGGQKCANCSREMTFRGWRGAPQPLSPLSHSASDVDLARDKFQALVGTKGLSPEIDGGGWPDGLSKSASRKTAWAEKEEKKGTYTALWR